MTSYRLPTTPPLPRVDRRPRLRAQEPVNVPAATIIESQASEATREFEARYQLWGRGTRPEFIAWEYLTIQKKQVEGVDFVFQSSDFGGRRVFGGQVVDFWLFTKNIVWRVQGEFFHVLNASDRARDRAQRQQLTNQGNTVVDLYAQDLLQRPQYVLDRAWVGQQVQNPAIAL